MGVSAFCDITTGGLDPTGIVGHDCVALTFVFFALVV
jgi:hypothetical protein